VALYRKKSVISENVKRRRTFSFHFIFIKKYKMQKFIDLAEFFAFLDRLTTFARIWQQWLDFGSSWSPFLVAP
jgi:hypothetical protein